MRKLVVYNFINQYYLVMLIKIIKDKKDAYLKNFNKLEVLNPLLTLKRGYAIAKTEDKVISSSKDVKVGDMNNNSIVSDVWQESFEWGAMATGRSVPHHQVLSHQE